MQKIVAFVFSVLVLFQSINLGVEDFSRINVLLEHAQFHQETYGDSFSQFLAEHYGETIINHDNEHEEHENLPFKHQHQSCTHTTSAFLMETNNFEFTYNSFVEIPFNFFYKESTSLFEKHRLNP